MTNDEFDLTKINAFQTIGNSMQELPEYSGPNADLLDQVQLYLRIGVTIAGFGLILAALVIWFSKSNSNLEQTDSSRLISSGLFLAMGIGTIVYGWYWL